MLKELYEKNVSKLPQEIEMFDAIHKEVGFDSLYDHFRFKESDYEWDNLEAAALYKEEFEATQYSKNGTFSEFAAFLPVFESSDKKNAYDEYIKYIQCKKILDNHISSSTLSKSQYDKIYQMLSGVINDKAKALLDSYLTESNIKYAEYTDEDVVKQLDSTRKEEVERINNARRIDEIMRRMDEIINEIGNYKEVLSKQKLTVSELKDSCFNFSKSASFEDLEIEMKNKDTFIKNALRSNKVSINAVNKLYQNKSKIDESVNSLHGNLLELEKIIKKNLDDADIAMEKINEIKSLKKEGSLEINKFEYALSYQVHGSIVLGKAIDDNSRLINKVTNGLESIKYLFKSTKKEFKEAIQSVVEEMLKLQQEKRERDANEERKRIEEERKRREDQRNQQIMDLSEKCRKSSKIQSIYEGLFIQILICPLIVILGSLFMYISKKTIDIKAVIPYIILIAILTIIYMPIKIIADNDMKARRAVAKDTYIRRGTVMNVWLSFLFVVLGINIAISLFIDIVTEIDFPESYFVLPIFYKDLIFNLFKIIGGK